MLFGSPFSVALLHNLADFVSQIHYGREKPEHANAPDNMLSYSIRWEERLALKDRCLTADKERSWFKPTIRVHLIYAVIDFFHEIHSEPNEAFHFDVRTRIRRHRAGSA